MRSFFSRIHESVALAAIFALSVTLHVAWLANLLAHKIPLVRAWFTVSADIGPVSGMYLFTLIVFVLFFGLGVLAWKGKDCSHWRERILWFFMVSLVVFFVMTLPIVYDFGVLVE